MRATLSGADLGLQSASVVAFAAGSARLEGRSRATGGGCTVGCSGDPAARCTSTRPFSGIAPR